MEKGVFDKAKEIVKSRSTTKNRKGGKPGPYVHKVFDEETGRPLYLRNFQSGESVFVLNSKINELPKSKRIYIEVDVVTRAVKEAIQSEMDMAERMIRYLETEAMQKLLQKEQQQYSEKAWMIFQEMEQVEKDRIPIYEKFKNNELTELEYLDKKEEIQSQLQMYEMDFEGLMERFAEMKKAFSNENEWIKTFQRVELPEELKFEHVKKWVNKIIVSNFKEVYVYLTMQKWRDYFPKEWLEE